MQMKVQVEVQVYTCLKDLQFYDGNLLSLYIVIWLSLLYKFTRFFIYFLFLSEKGPTLETLDYTIRIGSTPFRDVYLYFSLLSIPFHSYPSLSIVLFASRFNFIVIYYS